MNERKEDTGESFERYQTVTNSLIKKYDGRFKNFKMHEITLKLAFQPHILDFAKIPEKFQMELIELSKDNIVKPQLDNKEDPAKIWKRAVEHASLPERARRLISCFSTICVYQSTLFYMRRIKNTLRAEMEHLENQLNLKHLR